MQQLVGILQQAGTDGLLKLDAFDAVLGREIHIPANALNGAPFGMKVVAELLSPPTETRMARAKIIEVLGDPARPDVAITAIIRRYGISERFPEAVLAEAEEFPLNPEKDAVAAEIASGRSDLRTWRCFTIDGADAKDLDDAVSIEHLPGGRFRLGVHIADVSHYVREGSALDIEAQKRGNSVYLVDRVVPMLPPRLSNGLCSLNPGHDRLTLSVIMNFNAEGIIDKGEIVRSVIHSKARTTYEEVREALETGNVLADRYPGFLEDLQAMRVLADKLSALRSARGALEFEFPETRVELDETGRPLSIAPYPLSFANELIESFMIAANEFVARELQTLQLPGVYRVHELPDREKLERFTNLAKTQGIKLRFRSAPRPIDLAGALEQIKHEPAAHTLSQLLLRSLAKARYAPENLGHFGLASENYLHFTSPIRRYPDLFVHRVITGLLTDNIHRKRWQAASEHVAENSSETERAADQAERDTVGQKATEYMAERIGEMFSGFVAGFNNAGIFVQLENTVEGMIPYRDLDQYYIYDENKLTASTRDGLSSFHLGDPVRVQVARADTVTRQIDFALLEAPAINSHPRVPMAVGGKSGRGKGKKPGVNSNAAYTPGQAKKMLDAKKRSKDRNKTRKKDRRKK